MSVIVGIGRLFSGPLPPPGGGLGRGGERFGTRETTRPRSSVRPDQDRINQPVGGLAGLFGEVVAAFGMLDAEPVGVAEELIDRAGGGGDPVDAVGPEVVVAGR